MSNIQKLLTRLDKVKQKPSSKHAESYQACCPAHDDKNPSLGIALAHDGRILLHCWAGCGAAEILSAIGLEMIDLFPNNDKRQPPGFKKPLYSQADYEEAYTTGRIAQLYIEADREPLDKDLAIIERSIKALGYLRSIILVRQHG